MTVKDIAGGTAGMSSRNLCTQAVFRNDVSGRSRGVREKREFIWPVPTYFFLPLGEVCFVGWSTPPFWIPSCWWLLHGRHGSMYSMCTRPVLYCLIQV